MMSKEQAESALTPYMNLLYDCIASGVTDLNELPAERIQHFTPRTLASMRHDDIVQRIRATFDGVEGVRVIERLGLVLMLIGDLIAMRFNKITTEGKFSSNETGQTQLFQDNQPLPDQPDLPGIPSKALRLVGGYVLNALGTAAEAVILVPVGSEWQLPLSPTAPIIDIAKARTEQPPTKKAKQVKSNKPKNQDRESKDDDDADEGGKG